MFHIHTLEGDHYDIALEALLHRKDVGRTDVKSPVRKFIRGEKPPEGREGIEYTRSYADKRYRETVENLKVPEEIFFAYQIMSSPVKTLKPGMKVTDAWNYFRHAGVRHMPVLSEEGRIIGMVSDRDLLKYLLISRDSVINQAEELVADIMVKEVITAGRNTDIRRIAMLMFNRHIGTMPILGDDRKLVGIITRSDILHALINYQPLKLWG